MTTLTIFFNSDSDVHNTMPYIEPIYGLDEINTATRPPLITALSNKSACFARYVHFHGLPPKYMTRCIFNGPGSGYFLSDEKLSGAFHWSVEQFTTEWKININSLFCFLFNQRNSFVRHPPFELGDEYLAEMKIPNDWYVTHFTPPSNPSRFGGFWISRLNLVGWGRGAVSCHMLANLLINQAIPVNILAIDPVIGNIDPAPEQRVLGSNVKEYVGFYARDERSANLPCIVPDTAPNTLVHIYPISGRHTTLIGNQAADGESRPGTFSEPSDLVFYLAMKCLNRWDPGLSINTTDSGGYPDLSATGNQVLAKIKSEYDNYIYMRNTTYSNQSQEIKNDRVILLNGQLTNFKAAQGARFTPSQGLAKGHIEDMSYFHDII